MTVGKRSNLRASLVVVLVAATALQVSGQLQCNVPGEVIGGQLIGLTTAFSYNWCVEACRRNADCHWFTFFSEQSSCFEYADCEVIEERCSTCFSGQRDCQDVPVVCREPGQCNADNIIDAPLFETEEECAKACYRTRRCNWYTYFPSSTQCLLSEDCKVVDKTCQGHCFHGQRQCHEEDPDSFNTLVVIGGFGSTYLGHMEVLDLTGERVCDDFPNFPVPLEGPVGTYLDGQLVVCSGMSEIIIAHHRECYTLSMTEKFWRLSEPLLDVRRSAASIRLSDSRWWITGGLQGISDVMAATEIVSLGWEAVPSVTLPSVAGLHNLVRVNETHIILSGGGLEGIEIYIFDTGSALWSRLPDAPVEETGFHSGMVHFPNDTDRFVIAASMVSYALDLSLMEWESFPTVPEPIAFGSSLAYKNGFLVAGGFDDDDAGDDQLDVYHFDVGVGDWVLIPSTLNASRPTSAMFLVPDDFFDCDNNPK